MRSNGTCNNSNLLRRLDDKAALTVAVFDACREIPDLQNAVAEATRGGEFGHDAFRGLARVQTRGRSRIVAFAGAAGQLVKDGDGRHSPYTRLLLDELGERMEVGDLFRRVVWRFGQGDGGQQPEVLIQGVPPGRFYFIPAPPGAPGAGPIAPGGIPMQPNPEQAQELQFWQSVEARPSLEGYRAYLDTYPQGGFVALARARIAELETQTATPQTPATLAFSVKATPPNATVRIMNIVPRYQDGMELTPGRYQIEATAPGYERYLEWFELKEGSFGDCVGRGGTVVFWGPQDQRQHPGEAHGSDEPIHNRLGAARAVAGDRCPV